MFKNTDFFVIIREESGENSIRRLGLDREAQNCLCTLFSEAMNEFKGEGLEIIEFTVDYRASQDQIQEISEYRLEELIIEALKEPTSIELFIPKRDEYPNIRSIFTGIIDPQVLITFQRFNKGQYIGRRGLSLFHSEETLKKVTSFGMNINTKIDAIYEDCSLLFKSYYNANQIFDLAMYYRSASDGDIQAFLNSDKIITEDEDVFIENADTWVRKKVALIQDSKVLEINTVDQILEVASEHNIVINTRIDDEMGKIVLPGDKKEMKNLLKFLDEDIYIGALSDMRYETNSKRRFS